MPSFSAAVTLQLECEREPIQMLGYSTAAQVEELAMSEGMFDFVLSKKFGMEVQIQLWKTGSSYVTGRVRSDKENAMGDSGGT